MNDIDGDDNNDGLNNCLSPHKNIFKFLADAKAIVSCAKMHHLKYQQ